MRKLTLTVSIEGLSETLVDELHAALAAQCEDFPNFTVDRDPRNPALKIDSYVDMILKHFPNKNLRWAETQLARALNNVGPDAAKDHDVIMEVLCEEFGIGKGA